MYLTILERLYTTQKGPFSEIAGLDNTIDIHVTDGTIVVFVMLLKGRRLPRHHTQESSPVLLKRVAHKYQWKLMKVLWTSLGEMVASHAT